MEAACGRAETAKNLRTDPPAFGSKGFMQTLGRPGADPQAVTWTPELIRRELEFYARFTEEPVARFVEAVRAGLEERAEELTRRARRLEREANAVARLLDRETERKRAAKLFPETAATNVLPNTNGTCTGCSRPRSTSWNDSRPAAGVNQFRHPQ